MLCSTFQEGQVYCSRLHNEVNCNCLQRGNTRFALINGLLTNEGVAIDLLTVNTTEAWRRQ